MNPKGVLHLFILALEVETKTFFVICLNSVSPCLWGSGTRFFLSLPALPWEAPVAKRGSLALQTLWKPNPRLWVLGSRGTAQLVLLGTPHCQLPHPERSFWILTKRTQE